MSDHSLSRPSFFEKWRVRKSIALIKTHKTASSALRHVLERYAVRYSLKSLFLEVDGTRQGYIPKEFRPDLEPPYQISTRHLRYDPSLFDTLMVDPIYLTIVRDPLERMYSHFHYLNPDVDQYENFDDWYLNRDPENSVVAKGFDNYLATWLGYTAAEEITRDSLRERFAFIGVQEHFHESLVLLSRVLRCPVEILWHEQVRVNKKKPPLEISAGVREQFIANNALDYQLYRLCVERFEEDRAHYGATFSRDSEQLRVACDRATS